MVQMTSMGTPRTIMNDENAETGRFQDEGREYDAILVMSFGGPEGIEDVVPFLENVTRGRNIPRERLEEVGEHYYMFDGVSPINAQNRTLIDALREELAEHDIDMPIYFGNRNWYPMIGDTMQRMKDDGVKRAISFFTSGFSCYSGCRQYRENIVDAQKYVGEGAPRVDKTRMFYNHPLYIEVCAENLNNALAQFPEDERDDVAIAFTAHSIPMGMARNSDYEVQLMEASRLTAQMAGVENWNLVYQSRSGPPHIPWLEPDILDYMDELNEQGVKNMVILPIGFISDHMEVMFD
ncbi:MAG: ferrochelatase, partial [Chloroflexota bacterium]